MDNQTKRIIVETIKSGKEIGQCVVCGRRIMHYESRYCPNGILHCMECGQRISPRDMDDELQKLAKELGATRLSK